MHNLQWLKEDADYGLGLSLSNAEEANNAREDRQVRKFNAWLEDWEEVSIHKKDSLHENKLLVKYKDLFFKGDDGTLMKIYGGNLEWKKKSGWNVIAMPEDYIGDGSPDDEKN